MELASVPPSLNPILSDQEVMSLCENSEAKMHALRSFIRGYDSALVAFSGGVDSTFVLKIVVEELGNKALGVTAISASVSPDEANDAKSLAKLIGAQHLCVESNELKDPRYAANPANRCYFCKTELYEITEKIRSEKGLSVVLDGFNADDKKDHRPGHQAAQEHEVKSPLAQAGLTKNEIRAWSKRLGLPTWEKPQMACLASRIPYGTQVTVERLQKIGNTESALRALGLRNFRVRFHGEVARLELASEEWSLFLEPKFRVEIDSAIKSFGFTFVALDLLPFKSGRMNALLQNTVNDASSH